MKKWLSVLFGGGLLALGLAGPASALTLTVVDSGNYSFGAFGLLFDDTNVWVSTGVGSNVIAQINQNAPGMPLTGVTRTLTGGGTGAMAWDGSRFVSASGKTVFFFNAATGALDSSLAVDPGITGFSLIDGLGFNAASNEIWFSPDVGNVYRLDATTGLFKGPNPVLGGAGGFSGVERIDVGGNSFLIVVNDAFIPRQLCKTGLDGSFNPVADCAQLPNQRYEDLAFDGRFLYAADVFGNRVDKIDLAMDGGSIFVPEPASLILVGTGLVGLGLIAWRRRRES